MRIAPPVLYVVGLLFALLLLAGGICCATAAHYLTEESHYYIYNVLSGVSAVNFVIGATLFITSFICSLSDSENRR